MREYQPLRSNLIYWYDSFLGILTRLTFCFYSLFGSSRQLAIGPVALISLLLATGIESILDARNVTEETPNYEQTYASLAVQISFLVGITNIIMGILRLGFVTIFLSHAVISGFTTGAAVIIGMSQVSVLLVDLQ